MCLDPAALERIHQIGGEPLVSQMIALFRDNVPRWIGDARRGLESGDVQDVERACHALRSSAGNLGADRLMELATEIEQLAAAGGDERLPRLIERLAAAYAEVESRLERQEPGA